MSDTADFEMLDVHYPGPINPEREKGIIEIAEQFRGWLIERKESYVSQHVCLCLAFPDYNSAGKAGFALSDAGEHVEGAFSVNDE